MRMSVSLFVVLVAGLASAAAQTEVLFSLDTRDSIRGGPPSGPAEVFQESDVYSATPWSVDVLLGIETGIRLKRCINGNKSYGWMAEAFVGLDYVLFPAAGVGLRYGMAPWTGRHNSLSISPGVDVHVLANPFSNVGGLFGFGPTGFGLITADVDLSWRHVYTDSFSGEIGFKLGAGVPIGKIQHIVVPVVSIYAGFRF
jgi:hypothetical protein